MKTMFKKIISTIWEYFLAFMILIVIVCMYMYERYEQQESQATTTESCDTLITPLPRVIDY